MNPSQNPRPQVERNDRDLFFVVKLSSALGLGTLAAFLYSLKEVHPTLRIEIGLGAVITFLITAAVAWFFCGVMVRADSEADTAAGRTATRRRFFKRWLILFGGLCGVGTIVAFVRSLRNVGSQGRNEVIIGTLLAVVVLSCGGWLIHRAVRFFEEQDRVELDRRNEEESPDE